MTFKNTFICAVCAMLATISLAGCGASSEAAPAPITPTPAVPAATTTAATVETTSVTTAATTKPAETSLQSLTFPDSVRSIGTNAFRDCTSLQLLTISDRMMKDKKDDPYSGYTHSLWI